MAAIILLFGVVWALAMIAITVALRWAIEKVIEKVLGL